MLLRRCLVRARATQHQRRHFPTAYIRDVDGDIYLVGTAHIGKKSREEVVDIIDKVQPKAVMVELCRGRAASLRRGGGRGGGGDSATLRMMLERFGLDRRAAELALGVFNRVAGVLGEQGGDMLAALEAGERVDARIVHGDVDGATTERRVRAARKARRVASGRRRAMKLSTDADVARVVASIGAGALADGGLEGAVGGVLNRESAAARRRPRPPRRRGRAARATPTWPTGQAAAKAHGSVVGVVGIAHMDGIERRFPNATVVHLDGA
ncbi:intracellular chloride channel [Aureococcus anophagefferens]|nr:intracellular chloride channel [Aureococcus anophagefferens]